MARIHTWKAVAATLVSVALLALSACASGDGSSTDADASGLPADIKEQGHIRVAVNAEYPPWEYLDDGGKYVGIGVELNDAIAKRLGTKIKYSNLAFDAVIPGLQSRRYDMASSAITDTKERQGVVDFVDFFEKVNVLVVPRENPEGIEKLGDLCGKTVSAQSGSDWADLFEEQDAACEKDGKPGLEFKLFPLTTEAALAVESGRASATLEDYVSAVERSSEPDSKLEVLTETTYAPSLYGFAFPKNSGLTKAWHKTLEAIMKDGTYSSIFKKWDVEVGLLDAPRINGGS